MTTSKSGTAGGAGPEQNLHLDHDSALEALGTAPSGSRLDQARDAVTGAAAAVGDRVGQARDAVTDAVQDVRGRASDFYDDARHGVRRAYATGTDRFDDLRSRGYDAASSGRDSVEDFVRENPLLVGVVGLAAGLLLGALLPRTRQEDQTIGRWADGYREDGVRYAREATQRGRHFVDRTVADIGSHVREVRDDLREEAPRAAASAERAGPSGRYQNH